MKLAVMGDIHSNHISFETCIKHALDQEVDEFLFLGDYVSDCPYPDKTMKMIYEIQQKYLCYFIRGNREDYMIDHKNNPEEKWVYNSCSGNLLYTYENLTQKDFDFFENIGIHGIYQKKGYAPFRYCHGSLTSSNELLIPENENMESIMKNLDVNLLISGHTHIQESRMYENKKLIHPGSVGVPWYHGGKSQYMILHSIEKSKYSNINNSENIQNIGWEEEFFQLDYDINAVKEEFETSGLLKKAPYWAKLVIHDLETGDDLSVPCLQLAMKLCREEQGTVNWPDVPEKYWEMAFEEYIK